MKCPSKMLLIFWNIKTMWVFMFQKYDKYDCTFIIIIFYDNSKLCTTYQDFVIILQAQIGETKEMIEELENFENYGAGTPGSPLPRFLARYNHPLPAM